ncbi:MAG: hypothetical protein K2Q20_10290, partial [Phycisphaerales bacterium]|nr:hypothetical protein [Phycisphaerales bacterium]
AACALSWLRSQGVVVARPSPRARANEYRVDYGRLAAMASREPLVDPVGVMRRPKRIRRRGIEGSRDRGGKRHRAPGTGHQPTWDQIGGGAVNTLVLLAAVGVAKGLVWLWRLRAGRGSSLLNVAGSTLALCGLRVAFIAGGVSAVLAGDVWAGGAVYAVSAAGATGLAHVWAERRWS